MSDRIEAKLGNNGASAFKMRQALEVAAGSDGVISIDEFKHLMMTVVGITLEQDDLLAVYGIFDRDGSGFCDLEEMMRVLLDDDYFSFYLGKNHKIERELTAVTDADIMSMAAMAERVSTGRFFRLSRVIVTTSALIVIAVYLERCIIVGRDPRGREMPSHLTSVRPFPCQIHDIGDMVKVFQIFDSNHSGRISRAEFSLGCQKMNCPLSSAGVEVYWNKCDASGNDYIEFAELCKMFAADYRDYLEGNKSKLQPTSNMRYGMSVHVGPAFERVDNSDQHLK